jgi:hypothetical protein
VKVQSIRNERELQDLVLQTAHVFRWRVAHFRSVLTKHGWQTPVAADGAGFPDFLLARDRLVFMEFKHGYNKLEPEQVIWKEWIEAAGVEWYEIRAAQWFDGTVDRILR